VAPEAGVGVETGSADPAAEENKQQQQQQHQEEEEEEELDDETLDELVYIDPSSVKDVLTWSMMRSIIRVYGQSYMMRGTCGSEASANKTPPSSCALMHTLPPRQLYSATLLVRAHATLLC
jgi:hypothetical protein